MSYFCADNIACIQYVAEERLTLDTVLDAYRQGEETVVGGEPDVAIDSVSNFRNFFKHFKAGSTENQAISHIIMHFAGILAARDMNTREEQTVHGKQYELPRQLHSDDLKFGLDAMTNVIVNSRPSLFKQMVSKQIYPISRIVGNSYKMYAEVGSDILDVDLYDYDIDEAHINIHFETKVVGRRPLRNLDQLVYDLKEEALKDYQKGLPKLGHRMLLMDVRVHERTVSRDMIEDRISKLKVEKRKEFFQKRNFKQKDGKELETWERGQFKVDEREIEKEAREYLLTNRKSAVQEVVQQQIVKKVKVKIGENIEEFSNVSCALEAKKSCEPSKFGENDSRSCRFISGGFTFFFPYILSFILKAVWEEKNKSRRVDLDYEKEMENFRRMLKELSISDLRANFDKYGVSEDTNRMAKLSSIMRELSQRVEPQLPSLSIRKEPPNVGAGNDTALIRHIAVSMRNPVYCVGCGKNSWHNVCIICNPDITNKEFGKKCLVCVGMSGDDLPAGYYTNRETSHQKVKRKRAEKYKLLEEGEDTDI